MRRARRLVALAALGVAFCKLPGPLFGAAYSVGFYYVAAHAVRLLGRRASPVRVLVLAAFWPAWIPWAILAKPLTRNPNEVDPCESE